MSTELETLQQLHIDAAVVRDAIRQSIERLEADRNAWKARAEKAEADWKTERNMFKEFSAIRKDRENLLLSDISELRIVLLDLLDPTAIKWKAEHNAKLALAATKLSQLQVDRLNWSK